MANPTILLKNDKFPITVRQFGEGAIAAGRNRGITIIIDNFRASNTMLVLMEAGAIVTPVETIEQALSFYNYIKIGEEAGRRHPLLDFDNSPAFFHNNGAMVENKNVVIRTANGTRGIINAIGSKVIIVGAFRNLTAVVDYCLEFVKNSTPVSFVAMGSGDISRIEDVYGAKMMYYKLLEKLDKSSDTLNLLDSEDNPWNKDWRRIILDERGLKDHNREDRLLSLNLDETNMIPIYDTNSGKLQTVN